MTKEERFTEFLQRLTAAPAVSSQSAALALLSKTLNDVEDEFTEIPFSPENWQTDGRMYPPDEDNQREVSGRTDLTCFRNRGHYTYLRENGALEIRDLQRRVVFSKPGDDGRGVELT